MISGLVRNSMLGRTVSNNSKYLKTSGKRPYRFFYTVVVYGNISVFKEGIKIFSLIERISDGFRKFSFTADWYRFDPRKKLA